MRATGRGKRTRWGMAVVALLAAVPVFTIVTGDGAQAATALPGDGTTSASAGASCWGIKQQYGSSPTGTYWLNTPALERPQQFHCDMTTDGGGWVLLGRGRQGWTFNPFGQGSPSTVRSTVDGPDAFTPAALPTRTIDALLHGQPVRALADGIRLVRSTNSSGSNRQTFTMFPTYDDWTWSFPAGQLLDRVTIGNKTYRGSNTYDTASSSVAGQTTNELAGKSGLDRMWTYAWASHDNQQGFSFGSGVNGGSNSATNHLWTFKSEGSPIPFTQVWVRPRVANDAAGFTPLPAEGFAAEAEPATLKNRSELAPWGVVGMDHTNEPTIEPYNTNVLSLRVHGDRTFVGGRFTGVQNGPSGVEVDQGFLAAFTNDGTFIDSFRPEVNGRVWDMVMTPDGKLVIAGDFTSVNGAPDTQGIAALDPTTGAVIPGFKARAYRADGGRAFVRALDIRNNTIYAGGSFNRFHGGAWNPITVTNAISLSATDGSPGSWRPRPNASTVRLDVSTDGTRVLLAGYFSNVNLDDNHSRFAITDITTGIPVPGIGPWTPSVGSGTRTYQQAVEDLGDGRVAVGGSEHNIQLWNANRTQQLDAAITKKGGDTQAIESFAGTTYIGCHCGDWVYEGTNNFTTPTGFRSVKPINLVGAWNTETWQYDESWYPSSLKGAAGEGVWAIDRDARGCLWVGGDLERGAWSGNAEADWLGGFARFCPEDTTPPSTPWNLQATASGSGVDLTWNASEDAGGTVAYDVYRDDRVIATVWGRSYTDPEVDGQHAYTVRAVDARGNRSASPAPINVNGPSAVVAEAVAFGSTWRYLADGSNQGVAWRAPDFDHTSWPSGPGKLGWGRSDVVTNVGTTKPLTTYYRHQFDVANPGSVRTIGIGIYALQGAVVYVNGVEAGRLNMPAGAITSTTGAAGYLSAADETARKALTVPGSLLVAGRNTIAVEVHSVTAGASRQYFDLQATLYGAGGDTTAPSAPSLTATRTGTGATILAWSGAVDDTALGGYVVRRDGQPVAVTSAIATGFTDTGYDTAASHTWTVTAFDANGNTRASNAVTLAPQADPNLLAYGSTWRWTYVEGGPAATWATPAFDDRSWASGPGELGYGDADEKTLISTAPTPRPLTAYFRTTVTIDDPSAFTSVLAELIRDDGAVVYVNGVEVGRSNMPAGPVAFSTPASSIISDRSVERTPVQFTIPMAAFTPGANVIAVEVHNSDRWSGDLSMDLKLTGQR